jgi:hypothetical protein
MKYTLSALKMLVPVMALSLIMLAPAAVPIITPRATLRTIFICQGLTTGTVAMTDARGHTTTQTCDATRKSALGYPGLYPSADAPWLVIITVRPKAFQIGLPQTCQFRITSVPVHLQCAAPGLELLSVNFDLILTLDFRHVDLALEQLKIILD